MIAIGLRGRILVSRHGLNGTVGGDIDALKKYIKRPKGSLALKILSGNGVMAAVIISHV